MMNTIRWAASLLLSAFLVFMGIQKFGDSNPIFQHLAEQSGIELFEPVIRMLVGVSELAAAALILAALFAGVFRGAGALISTGVIGGAIVFHLSPWLGIVAPQAVSAEGVVEYGPMLFMMAVPLFLISSALVYIERDHLKALLGGTKPSQSPE
jgi:hypothetical protein